MTVGRVAAASLSLLWIAGCASVPDDGSSIAPAREPMVSASHEPRQLWLAVATPTDSNANGFADTFQVIVYLFPDREISAIPVWAEGMFEFVLTGPEGDPIDRWTFGLDPTERARQRLAPGPGFSFFLRLAEESDVREPVIATLTASFMAAESGQRLTGNGAASVRLGGR